MEERKRMLRLREQKNKKRPKFRRMEEWRYVRVHSGWRKPRGIDNHMREGIKGYPKRVKVGYRGPKLTRGLHSSGREVVYISRIEDLEGFQLETQIGIIRSTVGKKKRFEIIDQAEVIGIPLANKGTIDTVDSFDVEAPLDSDPSLDEEYQIVDEEKDDEFELLDDEDE